MPAAFSLQIGNVLLILGALWLVLLVGILITLSRRKDMFLPVKLFWVVVIFFAPVLGLVFYLVFGLKKGGH